VARLVNQTFRFGTRGFAKKSQNIIKLSIMLMMAQGFSSFADELVKTIPAQSFNIPAGDLTKALSEYSATAGVLLSFDSELTHNKTTQGLKGQYTVKDGFTTLLKDSGLEIINNKKGELELRKAPVVKVSENDSLPLNAELSTVQVRAKRFYEIGPLPGLGLTKDQIPGNVQTITAKEIKESHSLSITDLMNKKLQSVNVNDYQGNPFQMDVTYRGFTAGPQIGTPQGLSVFFDGIRVNEPFGDVVNWDMIPMNALASVDVFPGSNPIFGLNTLGGAFTVKTKDGFNNEGIDAEVLTGSFGRKQLQVEGGWNNGTVALFGAGNFFLEDGWRENSPSKVNQFFGKASYRGDKLDLNLSTLIVGTDLVGNGLLPSEMYKQDRNGSFTSEDETKNRLQQFQMSSSYFVNDNFTITGQVYRRNSKRKQVGADVYTDYDETAFVSRKLNPGDPANGVPAEQFTCLYNSNNANGFPDYYVIQLVDAADSSTTPFVQATLNNGGIPDFSGLTVNPDLSALGAPNNLVPYLLQEFRNNQNYFSQLYYTPQGVPLPDAISAPENPYLNPNDGLEFYFNTLDSGGFIAQKEPFGIFGAISQSFFYTPDPNNPGQGIKNVILLAPPVNASNCNGGVAFGEGSPLIQNPVTFRPTVVDGANDGSLGVVEGTPTSVITDNQIDQVTDGASIQFNWNLEHHKFMVGASIDRPTAEYTNSQKLGLLDASRKAYLAPDQIREQYAAASIGVQNNDFSGESITKSIYASETWSPIDTLHISGAVRYNDTKGKNTIKTRSFGFSVLDLAKFGAYPDSYNICPNSDCTGVPTGYRLPNLNNLLNPAETEKFSYYSLNPSLGATWQAKENLNVFANWAQGTRTPSVIELGCALDRTPTVVGFDSSGSPVYLPKSVAENRSCSLPSNLSGDPYLPQIKATTYDLGLRGTLNSFLGAENLQWNLGAYQTDLKDDIYFVALQDGRGFFDTVGKTRRRGIEAGLSGRKDKWGFGINYSLTDATFENNFLMYSADNSSAITVPGYGSENVIEVKKGNRIPGVPLQNLNANVSYEITDKWQVGLSAVLHSDSFVRGNENNQQKAGVVRTRQIVIYDDTGQATVANVALPPTQPGKVPGYTTFNFQTSYKLTSEWTASMLINNVFDKEYFTAGRLGRNPFSPNSTITPGAIGPDGYNHNSTNWLSTNFIAPGAPRGIWFSLNWQFDPNKK
jgi:outer membrane receptor for Fe3+-dicitrate